MTAALLERGELLFEGTVPGQPQRSKSHPTRRGGKMAMRPDDAWDAWRALAVTLLRAQWRRAPLVVPVVAEVVAVFERPARPRRTYEVKGRKLPYPWPWSEGRVPFIGRPDWDQVGKAGVDVCVKAGILADDPLVVNGGTPRFYAAAGEQPHVCIRLYQVAGVER